MIYNIKNKKGFTLMELLVTVILVAILASYGVYYYTDIINEGKLNAAKGKLAALGGATSRFLVETSIDPLGCSLGYDVGEDMYSVLSSRTLHCMGMTEDSYWYAFDVFACGFAEKSLTWDENFVFYFGCPNQHRCGTLNQITVFMKPKENAPSDSPKCAYFDPVFDKVIEVRD